MNALRLLPQRGRWRASRAPGRAVLAAGAAMAVVSALATVMALAAAGDPAPYIPMDGIDNWRAEPFCGNAATHAFVQGPKLEGGVPGILAFDHAGNAYAACETFIELITKDGQVRMLTGSPEISGSTDGPPGAATFGNAIDIAIDPKSDDILYVVDGASLTLRKVHKQDGIWLTETIAGVPGQKGHRDGPANQALFTTPFESLTIDENGVIYLCDGDWLRKVEKGQVTTLSGGTGYRNGPLSQAQFARSQGRQHGLAYDGRGNLYLADKWNMAIRKIDLKKGEVSTYAGVEPGVAKGRPRDGKLLEARFNAAGGPNMIFYNAKLDCFIARSDDENAIRIIQGEFMKTFGPSPGAKTELTGLWKDCIGGLPCGIDAAGNVYVMGNNFIRVVKNGKEVGK